jgi:hypothetical protein
MQQATSTDPHLNAKANLSQASTGSNTKQSI